MSETMTRPATADTAQDRCLEAITAEAFFHWASGQSQGPENLPATAAGLPEQDRNPLPRLDGLEVPEVPRPRTGRDTQKGTQTSVDNIIEIPCDEDSSVEIAVISTDMPTSRIGMRLLPGSTEEDAPSGPCFAQSGGHCHEREN